MIHKLCIKNDIFSIEYDLKNINEKNLTTTEKIIEEVGNNIIRINKQKTMKIYYPKKEILVRLQICKQGEKTMYLTLCETTREEVIEFIKTIIKDKISPFPEGKRTSIHIRDAIGGQNLKSESISFYGLSTEEVMKLIFDKLENPKNILFKDL